MGSKPLIYCCVPREGIMTMTFWYGVVYWHVLAIIAVLLSLSEEQFIWFRKFIDPHDELTEDTILDYLDLMARLVIGYAYFYTCYLAYKRNFKPISKLLYFYAVDVIWDAWYLVLAFQEEFSRTMKKSEITVKDIPGNTEQVEVIVKGHIKYSTMIYLLLFYVIPLLNKIYVIMKIRAYAKYVKYKKEGSEMYLKAKE